MNCQVCGPVHGDAVRVYVRKDGFKNRQCIVCNRRRRKANYQKDPIGANVSARMERDALRLEVLQAYSPELSCSICQDRHLQFLVIDHILGGGCSHRNEIGRGSFYRRLRDDGFPEGYRVLCYNCNWKYGVRVQPKRELSDSTNIETVRKRAYRLRYPERYESYKAELRQQIRLRKQEVLAHYGVACLCCRISDLDVLSLDHTQGGGTKHRKELGKNGGDQFYRWILRSEFPAGFRTMCLNCNIATGTYGRCPHEDER